MEANAPLGAWPTAVQSRNQNMDGPRRNEMNDEMESELPPLKNSFAKAGRSKADSHAIRGEEAGCWAWWKCLLSCATQPPGG
jgi:hypothetical protein